MEFKLNPFIDTPYFLKAIANVEGSATRKYVRYEIKPGLIYDTDDYVDVTPNIEELIKNTVSYITYSSAAMTRLKEVGGKYSTQGCKSCGGRITQIKLSVFQEV